jgi:hypothetical protein
VQHDEEPLDVSFRAFQMAYPAARRKGGYLVMSMWLDAARSVGVETLCRALENHKASAQWSDPALVPGMDKWLREERWIQELPATLAAKPGGKVLPAWAQRALRVKGE